MTAPYRPSPAPKITTRLWSSEVALVEAATGVDVLAKDPAYVFSNGRKFEERAPYEAPDLPEEPTP